MPPKRKRAFEEFDPNKSDSNDDNFDPTEVGSRKGSKKPRSARESKSGRRRKRGYRGSDIDDDDQELLSDSQEGSFVDDSQEEADEDAPLNAAGRKTRKAAKTRQNYAESSDDVEELVEDSPVESPKKVIKLKVQNKAALAQTTRRSTRARTVDTEDEFVELSNSGRHVVRSRDSKSKSPETVASAARLRSSRAMKGLKAPETIDEATQESSGPKPKSDDADEPDELSQDLDTVPVEEPEDEDPHVAADALVEVDAGAEAEDLRPDQIIETQPEEEEDDEDDVPITRRARVTRASISAPSASGGAEADDSTSRRSRRLTQKTKSLAEPSSDFEPGDDSEEDRMSEPGKGQHARVDDDDDDDMESPTPRGRRAKRSRRSGQSSRRGADSGDEDPELDVDELQEEALELEQSSRPRRRPREEEPISYQESARRKRQPVNYYMPPLTSANIEEDEPEDPAPTPARGRGRRGGASTIWERNLNTTFGPFGGGGGAGSLLSGPWGTGAAGGVDSDSSDDEMVYRSNVAGNVGMTPTSAVPTGGLIAGGPGLGMDATGATPNVGKIKDRKALADADPLGVDMNVDFSKVGGLQGHIDQLKEMVQLPLLYPELFSRFHVTPPRGVLFHGPPGTGKTLLARALANSVGSGGKKISFYMRKGADALSKWVGEAEKQLRLLFEEARKTQPSIIFFDEIDGLAPVRSSKQEQIHASIVSTLLALMDGMDGRGQVIVIGATNRPDNIDPALRRPGRFDREFYFPLPDVEGRKSILNIHTKDWGLSDSFQQSLAQNTKGYGGADLRALCTEAALNAIQRTYPQIYSTQKKLVVDASKINVYASDFMISIKKLIPSSERSATSGASPLPEAIQPLLHNQLESAKRSLDDLLPRKKKFTALEEAMFEQLDDKDHGFGRERLYQEFERARIFRPRFLIYGMQGMGQAYLASAVLHYFEGVHVQNFDLPALIGDGRPMDQVIVGLFTEVRRHKPSVIYIPNIDAWYSVLEGSLALTTFKTMLKSIPPTDPILVLATAECETVGHPPALYRDFFGFTRKNVMEVRKSDSSKRRKYFAKTLDHVKLKPGDFPDPANRKKRVLEELPLAPVESPAPPTKTEQKSLQKRDHQLLNGLKIQLQPIMDQINRKYKKFRQPVIAQSQIDYLFAESNPEIVTPDITSVPRPFEVVKDKYGNDVLRDTLSGKTYFNLETTTIEERLSNGFYARPKDFLFDIRALAKDAKNIGDKERTLKANELLSNVEVDVAGIENNTAHVNWESLYRRQVERVKRAAEKDRKKKAMQSILDRVQSDIGGGNDSDSQGPVTLGEAVPGRTTARFQVRSPLSNGHGTPGDNTISSLSNGAITSNPEEKNDVQMADADVDQGETQYSIMGPPPSNKTGATQVSQKSAVTALPQGMSPSAVVNDASTTKTSDPSTNRSSNWSTQHTNGNHEEQNSGNRELPDTFPMNSPSQHTSSDEQWPHSQAHALARGKWPPMSDSPTSSQARSNPTQTPKGMRNLLNDSPPDDGDNGRHSGTTGSQPTQIEPSVESVLENIVSGTDDCTIEQLEQINRDIMDVIWQTRHEWNRTKVLQAVTSVYNQTIAEIESFENMEPLEEESLE